MICIKEENKKKIDSLEREANLFASFFLAPYEALNSFIKNNFVQELVVKEIVKIGQHFGLSRQATLWRLAEELREKSLISKGKYEELLLDAFRSDIVYGLDEAGEEQYDEKAVF